jgi:hypothetical protein
MHLYLIANQSTPIAMLYLCRTTLPAMLFVFVLFNLTQANAQKKLNYYLDTSRPDQLLTNIDTVVTFDPATYEETVKIVNSEIHTRVDQLPRYAAPGSTCEDLALAERDKCAQAAFAEDVQRNIIVPDEVKSGKVKGRVIIKAVITHGGGIWLRPVPFKSLSPACDQAAYRALMMLKGKWIMGKLKGAPVETEILIPIDF